MAVMVAALLLCEFPVARPVELMLAMRPGEALHATEYVRFAVVPSLYVPVAVNCSVKPAGTDAVEGVTAMDFSVAPVTFKVAEPVIPLLDALIVALPVAIARANPGLLIFATAVFEEVQAAVAVKSDVL